MPFFSVVIPLYNKENFVAGTINSILQQTFTDFELIIVNDVSTDNSLTVATRFTDPRITIINHTVNKGLSASRNTGIKAAKADYITFIDADDSWKPGFLEKTHTLILQFPEAGLFACKYAEVYPNGVTVEHPQIVPTGLVANFFESGLQQPIYCQSGFCAKKEVFGTAGYYDETITFSEDIDFNIRANFYYRLAYINEPLTLYLIHFENQITQNGIKSKTIPDFDNYEPLALNRPDIKRYLDFNRYTMAKRYKLAGDKTGYQKMISGLSTKNLNYKQKILLYAPLFVLKAIGKVKALLIKKGLNPTSY